MVGTVLLTGVATANRLARNRHKVLGSRFEDVAGNLAVRTGLQLWIASARRPDCWQPQRVGADGRRTRLEMLRKTA